MALRGSSTRDLEASAEPARPNRRPFAYRIPVSQETSARVAEPDCTATVEFGQRGQLEGVTTTNV